jgi:tetrahydromethanopterin S-methyltransferase subunit A/thymidylate synthase
MKVRIAKKAINFPNFQCKKIKPKAFPVERGSYLLGNEFSPVAVVIPMPDKNLLKAAVEAGACIAGHLVTANIGVEKLIANVISNPNIRFILLYGRESEGHLSAHSLKMLYRNGIDENGRIIGSEGLTPYIRNLPSEAVKRFREQIINIVDLLGHEDISLLKKMINFCLQEPENAREIEIDGDKFLLYDPGALNKEPLISRITAKLETSGVYETLSQFSTVLQAKTIASAYPLLIEAILSAGREVEDERGYLTKELLNVQVHIMAPYKWRIPKGYLPEGWIKSDEELKEYLEKYVQTYFNKKSVVVYDKGKIVLKNAEVSYTYGDRLTDYHGLNQLEVAVGAVKLAIKANRQTRRLVLSLVDPNVDLSVETEKMEIPCFTQYWIFNRKENEKWRLHATMFLRSHDALRAFPANSYAGTKILEYLAEKTSCEVGTLTMYFGSCHVYMDF